MKKKNERTVIEKGFYNHPQKSGRMQLKQYIIVREGGKKCLLLRFLNESDITVTGIEITLTQIRSHDKEPINTKVTCSGMRVRPGETYAMANAIVVSDDCVDFTINITRISSQGYYYYESGGKMISQYDPRQRYRTSKKYGNITIRRKKITSSVISAFIVVFGLLGFILFGEYMSSRLFGSFDTALLSFMERL